MPVSINLTNLRVSPDPVLLRAVRRPQATGVAALLATNIPAKHDERYMPKMADGRT